MLQSNMVVDIYMKPADPGIWIIGREMVGVYDEQPPWVPEVK